MRRIFINYRRQDTEGYAGRLYDHLAGHFQADDIFMDVSSIEPGADFVETLEQAVAACDVFIAMIGPQWLTVSAESGERRLDQWDDYVRIEIESALKQDKLVIPVLVGRVSMPQPDDLPQSMKMLSRRHAIELGQVGFAADVEKLIERIKEAVPRPGMRRDADPQRARQKEEALKKLRIELVGATDSPLYQHRNQSRHFPVLGDGNPDSNMIFIGESPGKYEAETGKPFHGPSGEVLDEMLRGIGLQRQEVFLTNVVLDSSPQKRVPTPEEIEFYAPFVDRLIAIIQPAVIVTLGRFAMEYILKKYDLPEKRVKISTQHGRLIKTEESYGEIHVVPMYHPAVVLYTASQRDVLVKDFEKLRLFL